MNGSSLHGRLAVRDALGVVVADRRENQLVITNQGAARVWPRLTTHPLDFCYNPSTMGGAIPLAVGFALGQPKLDVIVVSGDGALLMNLGSLVSVVASGVQNLTVIVLENGRFEVTGGQRTAGALASVDFRKAAESLGFPQAVTFDQLAPWREGWPKILASPGPRFVTLRVAPAEPEDLSTPSPSNESQLMRLRRALARRPLV